VISVLQAYHNLLGIFREALLFLYQSAGLCSGLLFTVAEDVKADVRC
jgi:hypothetical protein